MIQGGGLATPILHRLPGNVDLQLTGESIDIAEMDICARLRGIGGDLPVHQQTRNFVTSFYRLVQNCTELYKKGHCCTIVYKSPQAPTNITSLLMFRSLLQRAMGDDGCCGLLGP